MSGHPYPGNTLRLRNRRVTGRQELFTQGPRQLVTEQYSWAGRPVRGGDALAAQFPIPCTPHMYGLLLDETAEFYGQRVIAQSRSWCQAGRPVTAPPRGVVILYTSVNTESQPDSTAFEDAVVSALQSALQAQLEAQNIFCGLFRAIPFGNGDNNWPGQLGLPATGHSETNYTHDVVFSDDINGVPIVRSTPYTIYSPVVEPDLWRGRELLLVYVTVGGTFCALDNEFSHQNVGTVEDPDWQVSGYQRDIFVFTEDVTLCRDALDAVANQGMFRRFRLRCAHFATYFPFSGGVGYLPSAETSWDSMWAEFSSEGLNQCQAAVTPPGGEVQSFSKSASPSSLASQIETWIREFYNL